MANKLAKSKIANFVLGLKECWPNFNVTATDFLQPTLEINIKFYERFLNESGIQPEAILKAFSSMNSENIAENEEFLYCYVIYSCARRKYSLLGLTDYAITLTRFLNPSEDKNLTNRLTILCNNLFYVQMKYQEIIIPLKEKMLEEVNTVDHLKNEVVNLNDNLKSAGYSQVKNDNMKMSLENDKKTLSEYVFDSHEESAELSKKIQLLQSELKLCEAENDTLTNDLEDMLSKEEALKAQIVNNPENIVAERCKIEKQIQELQEHQEQSVRNLELKEVPESYSLKNYESVCCFMENFNTGKQLNDVDLIDEHKNETEKLLKEINISRKTVTEEHNLKLQLNREFEGMQEKFQSLELQYSTRAKCLDNEIHQLNNELSGIINQFEKTKIGVASYIESEKYIQNCSRQYKDEIQKQIANYKNMKSKILSARQSLHNSYVNTFDNIKKHYPKNE